MDRESLSVTVRVIAYKEVGWARATSRASGLTRRLGLGLGYYG